MKRVLSIVLCLMLVGSLFTLALSANAAVDDSAVAVAEDQTTADTGIDGGTPVPTVDVDTDATIADETVTDETAPVETIADETTVEETTEETIAPTTAETQEPTKAATQDETKPNKNNSPKTGDNMWLWIGIGIFAVALIAIIATVIAKKKAK